MSNDISIRPFTPQANALFRKAPVHKRALKRVGRLLRRKPKTVTESAKALGRSIAHAVKTAHPVAQAAMGAGAIAGTAYVGSKWAHKKTGQLGLEGRMVWAQHQDRTRPPIRGEVVSYKRTEDPLGRRCIMVVDHDGHAHAFAEREVELRGDAETWADAQPINKTELRESARNAMPFGDERYRVANTQKDRAELAALKPVFHTEAGEGHVGGDRQTG